MTEPVMQPQMPSLSPVSAGGLFGQSEMATLIRRYPWEVTSLGALAEWAPWLTHAVALMLNSPVAMVLLWGREGVLIYNDAYAEFAGARHPACLGMPALESWPEIADFNRDVIRRGWAGESWVYDNQKLTLLRNGQPEDVWLTLSYSPVPDEAGAPVGILCIVLDITRRVEAEQAMRLANERIELALQSGTVLGTWVWEIPENRVVADRRFAKVFSLNPDLAAAGLNVENFVASIHPEDQARVTGDIERSVEDGVPFRCEYRLRDGDERWIWVEGQGFCERDAEGRPLRFPGVLLNIDDRKQAELLQHTLTGELQHRIKNSFAMVKAIANQTLRNAEDIETARNSFGERLQALSRAHDILTRSSWSSAPIRTVVEGTLLPYQGADLPEDKALIRARGGEVFLTAKQALSLALTIHELATNAAKYGALSPAAGGKGWVGVHWEVDQGMFRFVWQEHDGPQVEVPTRRGFGSKLIERSLAADFGGQVQIEYRPTGVICKLEAPWDEKGEEGRNIKKKETLHRAMQPVTPAAR